jgi:hypothetical protein
LFNINKGGVGTTVGNAFGGAVGAVGRAFIKSGNDVSNSIVNSIDYVIDPWISAGSAALTEAIKAKQNFAFESEDTPSWDRFVKNATTKRYRTFAEGSEYYVEGNFGKALNFGTEVLFDPTTYLTLGASTASKAGRLALSTRFATKEMLTKYPEMASRLGNVARFGAAEIPAYIREAEGIFSGVKFFGKEIAYTDGLAAAWRNTGGSVRADIGDAFSKMVGPDVALAVAKKSMKPAIASGIFRAGTMILLAQWLSVPPACMPRELLVMVWQFLAQKNLTILVFLMLLNDRAMFLLVRLMLLTLLRTQHCVAV